MKNGSHVTFIARAALSAILCIGIFGIGEARAEKSKLKTNSTISVAGYDSTAGGVQNIALQKMAPDSSAITVKTPPHNAQIIDSMLKVAADSVKVTAASNVQVHSFSEEECPVLGGNLPKVLPASSKPYIVVADIYVPQGKTVRLEPGVVMLFKNFTGIHVEGRLVAEGTSEKPIVFSSEFDQKFNSSSALHANPFDWNGMYIHEGGLGSSLAFCWFRYSVYGINSLTRYIRIDNVTFQDNGRSDCVIEGLRRYAKSGVLSYALSLEDARKDGVPVKILMDPNAKKRNILKFGGLSLVAGGCIMAVFSAVQWHNDQSRLSTLSERIVVNENSNIIIMANPDWQKAKDDRDFDKGLTITGMVCALLGGAGFGVSFTF